MKILIQSIIFRRLFCRYSRTPLLSLPLRRAVTPLRRAVTPLLPYLVLLAAAPAGATVTAASLSTYLIPYQTISTTGTLVNYTIDALSSVEIDIYRLENVTDIPSAANQVAAIQQNGLAAGSYSYFWNALWLVGNDIGRMNGNYQFIITATSGGTATSFVIPTLLQITSIDIHNVTVVPSTDSASNPTLPYRITYDLAKDSLVTIQVLDSSGTVVRSLLTNTPQFGENIKTNFLTWDGLDNNNRPAALGIYTITFDARDPSSADTATQRTRTAAILSLARLGSSLNELFTTNAIVYPNPIRNGSATFQFLAVRNNANISLKIYTLAGDLVRDERFDNIATGNTVTFSWNTTNESGKEVGRGVYYYVVRQEDPEGTLQTVKKLAVIR